MVLCVAQSSVTLEDLAFAFGVRKGSHTDFCLQALLSLVWCLTISSSTSFFIQRTQHSEASTTPSVLCVKQKMTWEQPSTPLRGQAKVWSEVLLAQGDEFLSSCFSYTHLEKVNLFSPPSAPSWKIQGFPSLSPPLTFCLHFTVPASLPEPPVFTSVLQKANTPSEGFRNQRQLPSRQKEPKAATRVSRIAPLEVQGPLPASQTRPDSQRSAAEQVQGGRSPFPEFPWKHASIWVNMHLLSSSPHWC